MTGEAVNKMGGTNPIMKSTDTQNVTVHVRAIQQMPGGDTDQMETTSSGILRTHGNRRYLFYSEKAEDGSETRTVMKFDQRSAQLTRNGQISSVFVFDEKQHCRSSYTAPLTSFLVDIDTERYLLEEDEQHLHLTIHYQLSVEGSSPTGCQTEIEVRLL
ncbi:MAG TPA: hypothetical protein DCF66_02975 [Lachnospiraceae bacterium]|nr:hypothetical protein [Lachnospiraceae bacterium]